MTFSFKKDFWWLSFLAVVLLELLSFYGYLFPIINSSVYIVLLLIVLYLSLKNISWGLLIAWLELVIGSQGYLFSLDLMGLTLSLRIGIWLIIMSVWSYRFLQNPKNFINAVKWFKPLQVSYILLALAVLGGVAGGFLNNQEFNNIFFDANGWFYWLLILPWLIFDKSYLNHLWNLFTAGVGWIFVKTVIILYIFSHNFENLIEPLYLWLRDFRIGEMTYVTGNFWRVFMQSQSMALVALVLVIVWLWFNSPSLKQSLRQYKMMWLFGLVSLITTFLSYSRSFWLGIGAAGLFFLIYMLFKKFKWQRIVAGIISVFISSLAAFLLILIVINFPLPYVKPDASNLLASRITGASDEAAGGSRLALLGPLTAKIKSNLILGDGFGSTVTYFSKDPRVVAQTAGQTGEYTTYAFEWGYHDILLKIGLVGLLIYFYLFYNLYKLGLKRDGLLAGALFALLALIFVNITTPYLNHPLGIGLIIIVSYLTLNYETT